MAEGYLFEMERRGYLKAGHFVPEVVLEHPDLVKSLYEEFVHCGSDVVLAFTVCSRRSKGPFTYGVRVSVSVGFVGLVIFHI